MDVVTEQFQSRLSESALDPTYRSILAEFFDNYRAAVRGVLSPEACSAFFDEFLDVLDRLAAHPIPFGPFHRQIRAPFDYYTFGVEFLRPLVDPAASRLCGDAHLDQLSHQLAAGDNVVFLANHQTEGDPQAISLLLERAFEPVGREMIFVAGERVTTDPLAVPFSLGRNLICIYSKRYIDRPPEDRARKQAHNAGAMERMAARLAEGGACIYVAPSGGRDRRNAAGEIEIAAFDPKSVEMFALVGRRSSRPMHFYPMALKTYEFLPPPDTVRVEMGERRDVRRCGIGLAVGPEIDLTAAGAEADDRHAQREARARLAWQEVRRAYRLIADV